MELGTWNLQPGGFSGLACCNMTVGPITASGSVLIGADGAGGSLASSTALATRPKSQFPTPSPARKTKHVTTSACGWPTPPPSDIADSFDYNPIGVGCLQTALPGWRATLFVFLCRGPLGPGCAAFCSADGDADALPSAAEHRAPRVRSEACHGPVLTNYGVRGHPQSSPWLVCQSRGSLMQS